MSSGAKANATEADRFDDWPGIASGVRAASGAGQTLGSQASQQTDLPTAQGRPEQAALEARGTRPEARRARQQGKDGPGPAAGSDFAEECVGPGPDERTVALRGAVRRQEARSAAWKRWRPHRGRAVASLDSMDDEVEVDARLAQSRAAPDRSPRAVRSAVIIRRTCRLVSNAFADPRVGQPATACRRT